MTKWISRVHELPYLNLGNAYLTHGKQLEVAADLIDKALERLLAGELHRLRDVSGMMTQI